MSLRNFALVKWEDVVKSIKRVLKDTLENEISAAYSISLENLAVLSIVAKNIVDHSGWRWWRRPHQAYCYSARCWVYYLLCDTVEILRAKVYHQIVLQFLLVPVQRSGYFYVFNKDFVGKFHTKLQEITKLNWKWYWYWYLNW